MKALPILLLVGTLITIIFVILAIMVASATSKTSEVPSGPGPNPGPNPGPINSCNTSRCTSKLCLISESKFLSSYRRKTLSFSIDRSTLNLSDGKFFFPWPTNIQELDKQMDNKYILFGYCDLLGPQNLVRIERKVLANGDRQFLIMPINPVPFDGMPQGDYTRALHQNSEIIFEFENWLDSDGFPVMCYDSGFRASFRNFFNELQFRNLTSLSWGEISYDYNNRRETAVCNLFGLFSVNSDEVILSFRDKFGDILNVPNTWRIEEKFKERLKCEMGFMSQELITKLYVIISKSNADGSLIYYYEEYAVAQGMELDNDLINFKLRLTRPVYFSGVWKVYLSRFSNTTNTLQPWNQGNCQFNPFSMQ